MNVFDTSILRKLSSSHLTDNRYNQVSVRELSTAISEFLDHRFKGLAEAELTPIGEEFILISPEQLAYFLRNLLKIIDGRVYLYIKLSHTDSDFLIEIKPSELIEFDLSNQAILCSAANAAGFRIEIAKDGISLSVELESARPRIKAVYKKPKIDLSLLFESVFFE